MIFMHFFSVFVAILPSISLFCTFEIFHFLYTCVEVSVSVFFAFFVFFNLFHTIASSFLSSSINQSCSYFFFWEKNSDLLFLSAVSGTFNLCAGIYSVPLLCFFWDFQFLLWDLLCRICTFLSWTFPLLVLFLAWGGWRFCSCCCCALGFGEN